LNLVIDTFAWIEILRESPQGYAARVAIESADRCLTPSVVLAEVASACLRDGFSDELILEELLAIREASEVVPIEAGIALAASHCVQELRSRAKAQKRAPPGIADGLVLATARQNSAGILTGDSHFSELPGTVWLG